MLHSIALTQVRSLTQAQILDLLRLPCTPQQLFDCPEECFTQLAPSVRHELTQSFRQHRTEALERATQEVEFCQNHAVQALLWGAEGYPQRLIDCPDAPVLLYHRGAIGLNAPRVLSIVGTRRITPYGKDLCRLLVQELAQLVPDVLVVSGLAYGVDIHAHRACLEQGLPTVGVLAHGLDQLYPSSHRDTARHMIASGGLLTEYISGVRPLAGHFVRRNRIVAGMADATIVIESANKGGALITARIASSYHRPVMAFPGRVGDAYSEGCLRLVREKRAELITSGADLLELLGWQSTTQAQEAQQLELFATLSPMQQRILDTLSPTDGLTLPQLSTQTQLDATALRAQLFELELHGHITVSAGGLYRARPQRL